VTSWSLVQGNPTDCGASCYFETSWIRSQNKVGWTVGRRQQQIDNVVVWVRIKYRVGLQRLGGIVNRRERERKCYGIHEHIRIQMFTFFI